MKKLSSYQKLKAENAKLKADLRELAARPSSERSILIKFYEIYQQKFENMVWNGSYSLNEWSVNHYIKNQINNLK